MPDPFANLASIAPADIADPAAWAGGLAEMADWDAELEQTSDTPDFDLAANPEIDVGAGLSKDLAFMRRPTRRLFVDYRANPDAFRHMKRLPREGQSLHGIISGKYALFDLVPAILERTGDVIADLYICTLGFSKQNGADLCQMFDDRQVRRVSLVCSYYFEKTSTPIYDAVVPELLKRGQRVKAMRAHAKMLLVRMKSGAKYVVESSANLRSCKNVEQFVFTRCPRLYRFHRRWLEHEILHPVKEARRAA